MAKKSKADVARQDAATKAEKWLSELDLCGNAETEWIERGKRIVKRFRDERGTINDTAARFNILWSNVETLFPAIYSRTPKAEVTRRNKDADPVARTAAMIIERALQYEIDQYPDFEDSVKLAIMDRLLPGRGVVWLRFEQIEVARPESDDDEPAEQPQEPAAPEPMQLLTQPEQMPPLSPEQAPGMTLSNWDDLIVPEQEALTPEIKEHACVDYVYWEDFRHGQARIWADVPWVARREYLTKEEGVERFGDKFKEVPLKHEPIGLDEEAARTGAADDLRKAAIWEIWDKRSKTAIWLAEGYPGILDERADPYGLEGFFPIPKPLFSTTTSDQLIPVPDFTIYQDQARELDLITARIGGLVNALKLNGAYDAANADLARILESDDNTLIPVSNWAGLSEKGGLSGVMEWVPLKEVVGALQAAYIVRDQVKQVIYELTGISDIIRGATKANETATAQNIKRQFGSLRLQTRQREIAVFATEILRIKAQLMMDVYSPETLLAMSGIMDTEDAPHADAAIQMLQSEPLREYQIAVAADSLVAIDEEQEKASRMEFLNAIGGYIREAMMAVQQVPEMAPLAMELMMFAVRAFPAAKPVEGAFEAFQQALANKPPSDPNAGAKADAQAKQQIEMGKLQQQGQIEQMKMQMQGQIKQMELQADAQTNQIRAQADIQIQQSRLQMQSQLEQQRAQMQADIDRYRADVDAQSKGMIAAQQMEFDRWKAELEASVKIETANIASKAKVENAATATATNEIASEVTQ